MLFAIIKGYARFAIRIYCRKIIVNRPEWLRAKGPLLLACNHPNSFLDGIILTTLFEENIYALARGDAFHKPWHEKVLRWLHLLPVYRTSEGVENLEHNYTTFNACKEVFRQEGIIIIFSEGRCINEWRLRPLKKGTARLAIGAWEDGIDVTVLPVGLNYNPFRNFGKNVVIRFGEPLDRDAVMEHRTDGKMYLTFNSLLAVALEKLVYTINPTDKKTLKEKLSFPLPPLNTALLMLPALVGWLTHAPLYFPARAITQKHFDNDHFDSSLVSMLLLAYPVYLLILFLAAGVFYGWLTAVFVPVLLSFCAWSLVQVKPQV